MKAEFNNVLLHSKNLNDENHFIKTFNNLINYPVKLFFVDNAALIKDVLLNENIDIFFIKIEKEDEVNGIKTIRFINSFSSGCPLIIISDNHNLAIEFIKAGADDVVNNHQINTSCFITTIQCTIERKKNYYKLLIHKDHLFKTIVESTTESVFVKDINGNYLLANDAVARIANKKKEDILGKDDTNIYTPENAKLIMDGDKNVLNTGKTIGFYINITTPDGIKRIYDATKGPVKDEDGNIIGIFGISRDVTSKIEAERKLIESETKLKLLIENSNDIIILIDIDKNIKLIASSFFQKMGWDDAEVLENKLFYFIHPEDQNNFNTLVDKTLANADKTFNSILRFKAKDGNYLYFESRFVNCLKVNGINGIIISSFNIDEKIETEIKLKQSVSILQSTLESIAEGILVVSNEGKVISYNHAFKELWSIPNHVINTNDDNILLNHVLGQLKYPDLFVQKVQELYAHTEEISFDTIEFRDGKVFERYSQPQKIEGKSIGRVWSFRNITEKYSLDKELNLKNSAIANAISGMGMADLEGKIIYANDALLNMWGCKDKNEMIGKSLNDMFQSDRVHEVLNILRTEGSDKGEGFGKRKDGSIFNVEFSANIVMDEKGNPSRLFGSFIDITERKRLEQSLQESENLFRELAENAPGGIVLLDENNKYKYASTSTKRLMGYTPEEFIGKDPIEQTHPDDLLVLLPKLNEVLSHPDKVVTAQYRFKHADGSWRWLESTFSNLLNIQNVNSLLINFQDITEKINSEEQIIKLSSAVEQSSVSVIITDINGNIEYVNPSFTKITGYSFSEVKGKNTRMFKSGLMLPELYDNLWSTIRAGNEWRGELANKKKNGTIYWESVSIAPVFDKQRKIKHFISVR